MSQLLSKNQIKLIRSLKQRKYRYKLQKYILEGEKMILELSNVDPAKIDFIVVDENSNFPSSDNLFRTSGKTFKELSSLMNPQGVLAVCNIPDYYWEQATVRNQFSVFLDGIQDPGNLGTIIRSSDWFGITNVLIGPGTVDPFNEKAVQASMSSLFNIKLSMVSYEFLRTSGVKMLSADMKGEDAYTFDWPDEGILIMGNEGNGISRFVQELNPERITIPSSRKSFSESLNVSMAYTSLLTLRSVKLRGRKG
ncbi:TrmH family RNA methyltransferase [Membranihabitans maritimus]|uniref:TrmH family RNA methyltransferase n=1 Tax=Membranihabitans maritimus TaxID=2904244 RepID=UPI001F36F0AD|nr:RNA methyltransferase [Membranihabitans maritimus]